MKYQDLYEKVDELKVIDELIVVWDFIPRNSSLHVISQRHNLDITFGLDGTAKNHKVKEGVRIYNKDPDDAKAEALEDIAVSSEIGFGCSEDTKQKLDELVKFIMTA